VTRPLRKTIVILLVAIVAGLGAFSVGSYCWGKYQLRAAETALENHRLDEARNRIQHCLTIWPHSVPVHLVAARIARSAGDLEEAESHLMDCQRLVGNTDAIAMQRALMRVQRNETLSPALELQLGTWAQQPGPEAAEILDVLSGYYMRSYRLVAAAGCLDRWLELKPHDTLALVRRAGNSERRLMFDDALRDLARVRELEPGNKAARLRMGQILLQLKLKSGEATPIYEELFREDPDDPRVRLGLAQCRRLQGRIDEAQELVDTALAAHGDQLPLFIESGKLALDNNDLIVAEARLQKALALAPFDHEANHAMLLCLRRAGKTREMEVVEARIRRIEDDLLRLGKLSAQVLEAPTNAQLRVEIGQIFLGRGERADAERWLQSALQIDPDYAAAHDALAGYYESAGERERAAYHRSRAQKAVSPAP
jgi:tetratricopeptide (TPR) repeat protein